MQYAAVESHYGDDYIAEINSEKDIEEIEETCERCFDSDFVLGVFNTREEAEQFLR